MKFVEKKTMKTQKIKCCSFISHPVGIILSLKIFRSKNFCYLQTILHSTIITAVV